MTLSTLDYHNWATVQPTVQALLDEPLTAETVAPWLQLWSDLEAQFGEIMAQTYREITENTADEAAEARFTNLVENVMPPFQRAWQSLKQKLLAVEGYAPPDDIALIIKRFRNEADLFRDENVPLQTELMKLENEYSKLVGGMTVEWEGEEITMPAARHKLLDPDTTVREKAWRAIMERFLRERATLDELFLKMLELRRQLARNSGLESFRDYQWRVLGRFDYTPADCATFHDAIEHEVLPLAQRFYAEQRQALGVASLRPWDSPWESKFDPSGPPLQPFATADELEEGCARIFERVDPVLAEHFTAMRDGYLDLASRPNKAPGGYCNSFPVSGMAYIFMNAVGSQEDVNTLLHEGGHAFHFMESKQNPLIWQHNGPIEYCEVASMSMELLTAPYLAREEGGFYSEKDAHRANRLRLSESVLFLPYMAVVDSFQHWLYTEAPEAVTAADLDAKWSELWDRFLPGEDYSGLQAEKETGWHRKGHIFGVPFYYIEYGLAQIGAYQVWRNALEDQAEAVRLYRHGLELGDTRPLPELFAAMGITFAFDRATVGELMALVRDQVEALA